MKFQTYLSSIEKALVSSDGRALADLLGTHTKQSAKILVGLQDADAYNLQRVTQGLQAAYAPWGVIAMEHALTLISVRDEQWAEAFTHQAATVSNFFKFLQTSTAWSLPALYTLLKDLRLLAEQADSSAAAAGSGSGSVAPGMPCSEDCARTVNKAFTICATDRTNVGIHSRRQGVYKVASLSMRCYFKVDRTSLCKNLIRATASDPSIPPLESFPRADRVTWRYFVGLLAFLNGDEAGADEHLSWTFANCHASATRNQELILTYLIPIRMSRGTFPSSRLLARFPRLDALYGPFLRAIADGDVKAYDEALERNQKRLVDVSCWMTVERAREVCLRGCFKAVWLANDRSPRISVEDFQRAMEIQSVDVDIDEVECMIANMIYKGYMKGYISHEKRTVVLSKAGPFPSLKSRIKPAGG